MTDESSILDSHSLRSLLELLADGGYHSGEELGGLLGVSRAAVWKHLQKLEPLGISLSSIKGRGYCIEGGLDLINPDLLAERLCRLDSSLEVSVAPALDSTNGFLLRQPDPIKKIAIAEMQTAGRGRRGRHWISPFAQNLYLSIGWGFEGGVAALEGLSLAVGVALVKSLSRLGIEGVQLKWPNDVLYRQRKLAGILIEMTGDPTGFCRVVIGVGINVAMKSEAADTIDQPWVDLQQIACEQNVNLGSRTELAACLVEELVVLLQDYSRLGFSAYREAWQSLNAYSDLPVVLKSAQHEVKGTFRGVNSVGALILQTSCGEQIFHGGEVSLRGAT